MTDTATEAPAGNADTAAAEPGPPSRFTVLQELRLHATNVLGPAFQERISRLVRDADRRIPTEVVDFIEGIDHLAHYLFTGRKPNDTPPPTAAPTEPPTDGK